MTFHGYYADLSTYIRWGEQINQHFTDIYTTVSTASTNSGGFPGGRPGGGFPGGGNAGFPGGGNGGFPGRGGGGFPGDYSTARSTIPQPSPICLEPSSISTLICWSHSFIDFLRGGHPSHSWDREEPRPLSIAGLVWLKKKRSVCTRNAPISTAATRRQASARRSLGPICCARFVYTNVLVCQEASPFPNATLINGHTKPSL